MNTPLVSIILPAYNGDETIAFSIESVLNQDYKNWELIIINDYSKDNTENILLKYRDLNEKITYIRHEQNKGLQKTLNEGIRISNGKYIARIDQDDTWNSTSKLSKQIEFLEENPDYVLVGTDAIIHDKNGTSLGEYSLPKNDKEIRKNILSKNCFLHASIVAKKEAMEKVGLYGEDTGSFCIEDYELWLRLGTIGKFANLDFKGLSITIHTESITAKNRTRQARKILGVIPRYYKIYPNFIKGYAISSCRLIFFTLTSILPFNIGSIVYWVQKKYK